MSHRPDRVAIVTGAGRGIGAAIAQRLHADGMSVALLDLDGAAAKEVAERLSAGGPRVLAVTADVSVAEQVESAVAQVNADLGPPTVLVNNAGVTRDDLLFKMPEENWDLVMDVHLKGAFLMSRATQRHMVESCWGQGS